MTLEGFVDASAILRGGVYALCAKGVVIYIGKAKGLYSRIYTHRNLARRGQRGQAIPAWLPVKGFVFDEVWVRPCALDAVDALEAAMIERYKPRYNQLLKSHAKVSAPVAMVIRGIPVMLNQPRASIARRM